MPGRGNVRQFRVISPATSTICCQANYRKGDIVKQVPLCVFSMLTVVALAAGCAAGPPVTQVDESVPQILTVRGDGSMWFRERPIPERDVIIYANGVRGEKAAVRIRMEPLHPDFFRDTIIVVRE